MENDLMTRKALATKLGVHYITIGNWMKEGKIIESGEVQSVFDHTTEPYTRSLIETYSLSYAFTKGAES
jgi:ABC-type dipeptide/oligopeptide/nickel transport system ATPase component